MNPKPVHIGGESILDRILPHMKKILVAIAVTTVVLTVIFTRKWWVERGQAKDTLKIAAVMESGDKPIRAKGDTEDPKHPTFADHAARASEMLATATTNGAELAPLFKAGLLLDAGKIDDAIATYREASSAPELDGVLAREGLGLALEQKASAEKDATARQRGLEDALAAFQSEQPVENGPRYAYALYHQGRMLALLGKKPEAKAALDKAKEAAKKESEPEMRPGQPGYGAPSLGDLVESRINALGAS